MKTYTGPHVQDSIVFEVTQRCNYDCLHCYNVWKNGVEYPQGEQDTESALLTLARMLDDTGARRVTLTGGEPLLRPDLDQIVDFLVRRGVAINLVTNGSLLDDSTIRRLSANKIQAFELPLLSCDRAIHDRLSGLTGAFDHVCRAIADLKAAKQRVIGVFVATALNLHTWPTTLEMGIALGLDARATEPKVPECYSRILDTPGSHH